MENLSYYQPESGASKWQEMIFYVLAGILAVVIFSYAALEVKVYFQKWQLAKESQAISLIAQQKDAQEKEVLLVKKSIEDFSVLLKNHTVASGALDFIGKNTLEQVTFSSVSMSEVMGEIRLTGQAKTMAVLSRQLALFEVDKSNIKAVSVVDSKVDAKGMVAFVVSLSTNPTIFTYGN